ncbi:MAG: hypothetical protein SP1CHLAM54_05810 [Chlamydiia bacterium]|nr:hypothetical protein [Chlamydiia bacterium]MCH9615491.1 hypothetical protein [Chlamydiia bacterium]MCH9629146.1 hypothetical protein [Chlamydiia bacterium]
MSITVKSLDPTISVDKSYFLQEARAIQNRAQHLVIVPVLTAFDELLGPKAPTWATFEPPPGHPSVRMFLCGVCPDIDFESILKHPNEILIDLYLLIKKLGELILYTMAKLTFSKG